MLVDTLAHVPYAKAHFEVSSSKLVTGILEACSQLDSLRKAEAVTQNLCAAEDRCTIEDHFTRFGTFEAVIAERWLTFSKDAAYIEEFQKGVSR